MGLLQEVELRSSREKPLEAVYQISSEKIRVRVDWEQYLCQVCRRVMNRPAPRFRCSRHHCPGTIVFQEPEQENYDVNLMQRAFTMVAAEEHTAQVPGEMREIIEREFKSETGRVNCLVATPTLEMGVNIGALDMIFMRNVPPLPFNYWQRAGRAGRQERMAVITTYCSRSSHDRYFFEDPLRLLNGSIEVPAFNLKNPLMIAKHVRSALLSQLLPKSQQDAQLKKILTTTFPHFIRDYFVDANNNYLLEPLSTTDLHTWIEQHKTSLIPPLRILFAQYWPADIAGLTSHSAIERILLETASSLSTVIRRLHRRFLWARDKREELHREKDRRILEKEEEQLLRRCDYFIGNIMKRDKSTYTLLVLGQEGFLPGYGIYDGGIVASAEKGFAKSPGPRVFELNRNPAVALREFVPGNRLYANGGSFYVSRYHLTAHQHAHLQSLLVNPQKHWVMEPANAAIYGQSGNTIMTALPIADLDLTHEGRITEEENLRFAMPVTILGYLRKYTRGGKAYKIGEFEVHHLRGQGLQLVNLGEAGRVRKGELGHLICTVCGAAKTPYAVETETQRFIDYHTTGLCGKPPVQVLLTADAEVDTLLFSGVPNEETAYNIGEALPAAAYQLLEMGENDLEILLTRKTDDTLDLLIFDPMPGGSGLIEQMLERWRELINSGLALLSECPDRCETSCYACLRSYRNQFYHEYLNRRLVLELLVKLDSLPQSYRDIPPVFEEPITDAIGPSNQPEALLLRMLMDHHFPPGKCRERILISDNMYETPDWVFLDETNLDIKVAVYLDGMSRNLHGDPKTMKKDNLRRQLMELEGYKVIIVQSRDLSDPEAMRLHLTKIAQAIGREDLMQ